MGDGRERVDAGEVLRFGHSQTRAGASLDPGMSIASIVGREESDPIVGIGFAIDEASGRIRCCVFNAAAYKLF